MQLTSRKRRDRGEPVRPAGIVDDSGLRGGAFIALAAAAILWGGLVVAFVLTAGGSAQ